jgi:DNA-binding CsgD family transcriptional regulator
MSDDFNWGSNTVRALLRLSHDLHTLPADPIVRQRQLLSGACALLKAQVGFSIVGTLGSGGPSWKPSSFAHVGLHGHRAPALAHHFLRTAQPADPALDAIDRRLAIRAGKSITRTRQQLVADRKWYAFEHVTALRQPLGIDHCIYSSVPLTDHGLVATVCLARPADDRRPFNPDDCRLLELLHEEARWIYLSDVTLTATGELRALSPRQKLTLQYLLAGLSEKQIAARTRLSRNTVHHYVKAIYRHLGVTSRSELLARWVRTEG